MFGIYDRTLLRSFRKNRTGALDFEFGISEQLSMTIAEYRASLGLNQEAFGALLGIASKGHVSEIERANACAVKIALAIEEHSSGLVDAATLNADVAAARKAAA